MGYIREGLKESFREVGSGIYKVGYFLFPFTEYKTAMRLAREELLSKKKLYRKNLAVAYGALKGTLGGFTIPTLIYLITGTVLTPVGSIVIIGSASAGMLVNAVGTRCAFKISTLKTLEDIANENKIKIISEP